jgi:hypothetical protein
MDKAQFWTKKPPLLAEYEAVVFEHPSFAAPIRLVANVFDDVTLGGQLHTAAGMQIKRPESDTDGQPKLVLAFPRQSVGRQFKSQLRLIQAAASTAPIAVNFSIYTGSTVAPTVTWPLFIGDAGGIVFGPQSVQVTATVDNPMRRRAAAIYTPQVFTGLQGL